MDQNPYHDLSRTHLAAACHDILGDLQDQRPRNAVTRRDLAEKTCFLLITMISRLGSGEHMPLQPEYALNGDARKSLVNAFGEYYRRELKSLRYDVMQRAADYVTGNGWQWMTHQSAPTIEGRRISDVATQDDDGLIRVLQLLEQMRQDMAPPED